MDRISELPSFIIHNTMSYLSPKEVAQTSILSHRWKMLQTSFPTLDFDQRYFVNLLDDLLQRGQNENFRNGIREFIKHVDKSLNRTCELKFCMQKFRLFITLLNLQDLAYVDKWIGLVIEKGVKEFEFEVFASSTQRYTLPQTIFSAKLVTTLRLVHCKLDQPSCTIMFYSLKKLTLEEVYIKEEMLQKLISECPLLEDLAFSDCAGFEHFRVANALKLKILTFKFSFSMQLESVEIAVPSLQELTLESITLFPGPQALFDIVQCPRLEKLRFVDVNLRGQEFNHLISKFPLLENLTVKRCVFLERIKISSTRLKILEFSSCHNLKEVDIDTPNLLSFIYEHNPIPIASINAPCPWEIDFEFEGDLDTSFLINLKKFLGQSKQIKRLPITLKRSKVSFNLEELRESFPPFPFQVGSLDLIVMYVPSSEYEALLNGLFSICYPKTLSVLTGPKEMELGRWLHKELRNRDVNCCNSRPIKCWRHHFKAFKDLKINFLEGWKLLEEMDDINLVDGFPFFSCGTVTVQFHIY